jgi:hypothetical protein
MNIDLGYNAFFELNRKRLHWDEFSVARVIAEHRGSYKVRNATGIYAAKITGKQMFNASSREDYPTVGDWVAIAELQKKEKDRALEGHVADVDDPSVDDEEGDFENDDLDENSDDDQKETGKDSLKN